MSNPLLQFLQKHRCKKGEKWGPARTHYSISDPPGSYAIPPDMMAVFRTHYRETVFKRNIPTHIVEAPQDCTPIKIDLDFHYTLDKKPKQLRLYDEKHIQAFVQSYMRAIEEYLITPQDDERLCYILEKSTPVKNEKQGKNCWKDGIHVIFPKIICHHTVQALIRKAVLKTIHECFPKEQYTNEWSDILDSHIIRSSGWQMLGSTKPGKEPYALTRAYNVTPDDCEKVDIESIDIIERLESTTMLGYTETDCLLIKQSKKDEVERKIRASKPNQVYTNSIKPHVIREYGSKLQTADNDLLTLTKKLVEILDPSRSKSYQTWIELGWCLHNIHNSDHKLLDTWTEFSKQSPRHAKEATFACRSAWTTMANEGLGIGTLRMWAKKDNNKAYQELIKDDLFPKILRMCGGEKVIVQPNDVAKLMATMYRDKYVCLSEKPEVWYGFSQPLQRWIQVDPVQIRKMITTEVFREFNDVHVHFMKRSQETDSDEFKTATNIFTAMQKLKQTTFKVNVVRELMEDFYDEQNKFFDTLDNKKHLIGLENGTYDLSTGTFREGRPDDRITLNTGCIYPVDIEDNEVSEQLLNRKAAEIKEFIKQILPNKEIRDFAMTLLASFLDGNTNEEYFHVWTGSGGNGKSKLIELFELAMGDYACKLPITLLTGKRGSSSAASPELAMLRGKRFACLQEPDKGSKIEAGLMKEMTGGDTIYARDLFAKPFKFKPQCKMILVCNEPPELAKDDGGVWRRVKMINFGSEFKPKEELTDKEGKWMNKGKKDEKWIPKNKEKPTYPLDGQIDQKFAQWKDTFLYMLLEQYKVYKEKGLIIPDAVKATTLNYQQSQFKLSEFIKDCVADSPMSETKVTINEIYSEYKDWYSENQGANKKEMLKKCDLQQFFSKYYKKHQVEGNSTLYTHIIVQSNLSQQDTISMASGGGKFGKKNTYIDDSESMCESFIEEDEE